MCMSQQAEGLWGWRGAVQMQPVGLSSSVHPEGSEQTGPHVHLLPANLTHCNESLHPGHPSDTIALLGSYLSE